MQYIPHSPSGWELLGQFIGGSVLPRLYENYNRRDAFKETQYQKAQEAQRLANTQYQQFNNNLTRYRNAADSNYNEYKSHADAYNSAQDDATRQKEAQWLTAAGKQINGNIDFTQNDAWTKAMADAKSGNDMRLKGYHDTLNGYGYSSLPNYRPATDGDFDAVGAGLKGIADYYGGYKDSQKNNTVSGGSFQDLNKYTMANPESAMFAGQPVVNDNISNIIQRQGTPLVVYMPRTAGGY